MNTKSTVGRTSVLFSLRLLSLVLVTVGAPVCGVLSAYAQEQQNKTRITRQDVETFLEEESWIAQKIEDFCRTKGRAPENAIQSKLAIGCPGSEGLREGMEQLLKAFKRAQFLDQRVEHLGGEKSEPGAALSAFGSLLKLRIIQGQIDRALKELGEQEHKEKPEQE